MCCRVEMLRNNTLSTGWLMQDLYDVIGFIKASGLSLEVEMNSIYIDVEMIQNADVSSINRSLPSRWPSTKIKFHANEYPLSIGRTMNPGKRQMILLEVVYFKALSIIVKAEKWFPWQLVLSCDTECKLQHLRASHYMKRQKGKNI